MRRALMACADSPANRSRQVYQSKCWWLGSRCLGWCRGLDGGALRSSYSRFPKENTMKTEKKLELSKETLRTLDEKDLTQVVGGDQSGANTPPQAGPNSCPNTKPHACS